MVWAREKGGHAGFCCDDGKETYYLGEQEDKTLAIILFMQWLVDYCGIAAATAAKYRFGVKYLHACHDLSSIDMSAYPIKLAAKGISHLAVRIRRPRLAITAQLMEKMNKVPDVKNTPQRRTSRDATTDIGAIRIGMALPPKRQQPVSHWSRSKNGVGGNPTPRCCTCISHCALPIANARR